MFASISSNEIKRTANKYREEFFMILSRVCYAASSVASGIVRPVLKKVEPSALDWSAFVHLSASEKIGFQAEVTEEGLTVHGKELLQRIKQSAYFLYGNNTVMGGIDAEKKGDCLSIQRVIVKPRFVGSEHQANMTSDLREWAVKQRLQLISKN